MDTLLNISPIYASMIVVLLPFLAFLVQALLGKKAKSGNIGLLAIAGSTIMCLLGVFMEVWHSTTMSQRWEWFVIGKSPFHFGILLNNLTVLMQLLVCIIALPVHIYSRAYMKGDEGIHRYWMYLSLFCFAMLGLTVSINLFQMYIFWELVGFSSYLLIGFWFTRESAVQANKKAFLVNRIGDIGFLIGLSLLFSHFGTLDIVDLFGTEGVFMKGFLNDGSWQVVDKNTLWITVAGVAFFLGAMAKSAQFPLHVWLPDAMEGPTSVSSLIHAATMVAAGVFLLCSVFPLFNDTVLLIIAVIGTLTATTAAIFALGQYDIKKILAFSTISQLGFMMVGVGIGAWDAAMFHLTTHAFFKCLLFLGAGAVIHEMAHLKAHYRLDIDPQDLRQMGGLRKYMPKTFILMAIASLALAGFPLTSGYLSKDSIVISAYEWASHLGGGRILIPIALIIVSLLTAFYIGRLIFKAFFGTFTHEEAIKEPISLHEAPVAMLIPMVFLVIGCLFIGYSLNPLNYHHSWLMESLHVNMTFTVVPLAHTIIPVFLTVGTLITWLIGWKWYVKKAYPLQAESKWILFSTRQGYLDEFNNRVFVQGTEKLSLALYWFDKHIIDGATKLLTRFTTGISTATHWIDKYIVDGFVNLAANTTYYIGHLVRHVQNGQLQAYLGFAFTVVVLGILYLIIR